MDLYEKLGMAKPADEETVKQVFREKKMALQKQLSAKNPDVQKQASADLSALIHAYAIWKKQQGTSNAEKAKIAAEAPAIKQSVQEAAPKEKPVSVPMESQAATAVNPPPSKQSTASDGLLQTVSREENVPTVKILIAVLGIIVVILVGYIVYMHSANQTTRENLNKKVDVVEAKSGSPNAQKEKESIQSTLRSIDHMDDEIGDLAQDINRMTGKKGDVRGDIRHIKEKGKDLQTTIDRISSQVQSNRHISAKHIEALAGLLALEKRRISLLMTGVDEWQDGSETLPSFKEGTRLSNEFAKVLAQYKAALESL